MIIINLGAEEKFLIGKKNNKSLFYFTFKLCASNGLAFSTIPVKWNVRWKLWVEKFRKYVFKKKLNHFKKNVFSKIFKESQTNLCF